MTCSACGGRYVAADGRQVRDRRAQPEPDDGAACGDEFAIILPGSQVRAAQAVWRKISWRRCGRKHQLRHRGSCFEQH